MANHTNTFLKTFQDPFTASDTSDHFVSQTADSVIEPVNHISKRMEYFILESHGAQLFPDLLYGIHFGCVWWNIKQLNIFGTHRCL